MAGYSRRENRVRIHLNDYQLDFVAFRIERRGAILTLDPDENYAKIDEVGCCHGL